VEQDTLLSGGAPGETREYYFLFTAVNPPLFVAESPLRARAIAAARSRDVLGFLRCADCEVALRYYRPRAAVLSWVAADKSDARRGIRGPRSGEKGSRRNRRIARGNRRIARGKSADRPDRAREIRGSRRIG